MPQHAIDRQIEAVRRFNRFYTQKIGVLEEGLLNSPLTLTEARVLYELAQRQRSTATELCRELGLDQGYVSRILARFGKQGLIAKAPSETDGRQTVLSLTDAGRAAFAPLDAASQRQVAAMLDRLSPLDRGRLAAAMETIATLLGDGAAAREPYILRPPEPGDMGWVVHRHGVLYAQEYGWDMTFEAFVAEIVANFVNNFDAKHERCWIAERHHEVAGSVFVVRESDEVAKLRMLYVEPSARGLGIGARLVEEAIRWCRQTGYKTLTLWTNDILHAARHIYQSHGFQLVKEERHHSFGKDLVGQYWRSDL